MRRIIFRRGPDEDGELLWWRKKILSFIWPCDERSLFFLHNNILWDLCVSDALLRCRISYRSIWWLLNWTLSPKKPKTLSERGRLSPNGPIIRCNGFSNNPQRPRSISTRYTVVAPKNPPDLHNSHALTECASGKNRRTELCISMGGYKIMSYNWCFLATKNEEWWELWVCLLTAGLVLIRLENGKWIANCVGFFLFAWWGRKLSSEWRGNELLKLHPERYLIDLLMLVGRLFYPPRE